MGTPSTLFSSTWTMSLAPDARAGSRGSCWHGSAPAVRAAGVIPGVQALR